nr:MAG TPA: hypothetical protein [Caudoviricetes sp.]
MKLKIKNYTIYISKQQIHHKDVIIKNLDKIINQDSNFIILKNLKNNLNYFLEFDKQQKFIRLLKVTDISFSIEYISKDKYYVSLGLISEQQNKFINKNIKTLKKIDQDIQFVHDFKELDI